MSPGAGPGGGEWCFVHAADLHLDTPFSGISRLDSDLADRLRDASLEAFDALVDLTLDRNAAVLLLAGDVFDDRNRDVRAQLRMLAGLERLSDAGIRTCIVAGNHDPLDGWSAIGSWPELVTEFESGAPGIVEVERDGDLLAVVTGISYAQKAETRNLASMLVRTDHDVPHIGLLHANVGSNPAHAPYAPCSVDDLRRGQIDYWALGHIHLREIVLDGSDEGPWAVYPGNLQGRSPKPSERGSKGASVVHVRTGRIVEVEHVALDRARFDEVPVEIGPDDDLPAVHRRLAAGARAAAAEAEGRILVLRGVITGRGDVHTDLVRPDAVDGMLQTLADEAPTNPPTAWTTLKVRTSPPRDPADAEAAQGLLADLAVVANDAMTDPGAWANGPLEAAAAIPRTPADDDDEPWDLQVDAELVERAAALAAAELARGLP